MASDGAKALLPFLQRADEMARHDRRVAYYCACPCQRARLVVSLTAGPAGRLYALEQGLALSGRTEETNALLGTLLKQLEVRPGCWREVPPDLLTAPSSCRLLDPAG
jgi:vacuolar protein sorting-associated protein VTA1